MDFDYEEADEFGGQILWARVGVFALAVIVLFALGRCTAGGGDVSQDELDAAVAAQASAEDALEANRSAVAELQQELQSARDSQANTGDPTTTTTGGTEGSESTGPDVADAPTDPEGNRLYEVQPNDNLSDIAQAVYNDPLAFGIIAEANGLTGSSPLQVGQELIIPPNPDSGQ